MTLRIGFIGCVKSSRALLEVLISMPEVDVCAIVTKQASKVNADFSDLTDIDVVITEDGTGATQTLSDVSASLSSNGNFVQVSIASSILVEESAYYMEFTKGGNIWFRDKAYVTTQVDKDIVHTINEGAYDFFEGDSDNKYIVLE